MYRRRSTVPPSARRAVRFSTAVRTMSPLTTTPPCVRLGAGRKTASLSGSFCFCVSTPISSSISSFLRAQKFLLSASQFSDIGRTNRGIDEAWHFGLTSARIPCAENQRSRRDLGKPPCASISALGKRRLKLSRERSRARQRIGLAMRQIEQVDDTTFDPNLYLRHKATIFGVLEHRFQAVCLRPDGVDDRKSVV